MLRPLNRSKCIFGQGSAPDPAGGNYITRPDPLAAQMFVAPFAEVGQGNSFIRKVVLSTKSDKSTYAVFARILHLFVHMEVKLESLVGGAGATWGGRLLPGAEGGWTPLGQEESLFLSQGFRSWF